MDEPVTRAIGQVAARLRRARAVARLLGSIGLSVLAVGLAQACTSKTISPTEGFKAVMDYDWAERNGYQVVRINNDSGFVPAFTQTTGISLADPKYRTAAKRVFAYTEKAARYTVEALASDIARLCLEDPKVVKVRVRVEKPGAVRFSRSVGVEIERSRPES